MANPNLVMQSHSNDKSSSIQKCADSKAARVYMAFAFFTEYRALYVELQAFVLLADSVRKEAYYPDNSGDLTIEQ